MNEDNVIYSFAWFQPKEWQLLKESVDDPTSLDNSYDEWRRQAESAIGEFRANGKKVKKVSINVSELLTWCESKGLKPDSKARSEFTAFKAEQRAK
ncbi:hypothetical protein [Psychromonas algicola]|uniref:hypothetical protein n=1 Tax=Psychromonas algicola TaxID=2555642 RepID=UPI0010673771|nr:hypothetical protein [Psychromonas sp. RZ5]TEW51222.1 hypothetical protein E2R67_08355 [Psychromonas sp. RZ5]